MKSIELLFEYLNSKALSATKAQQTLSRWNDSQAYSFLQRVSELTDTGKEYTTQSHSYISNGTLSGEPFPCRDIECRLNRVDDLARFASLYADKVLIYDPFEKYAHSGAKRNVQDQLYGDIRSLWILEPLLKGGFIKLSTGVFHYCEEHNKEVIQERHVYERIAKLRKELTDRYLKQSHVSIGIPESGSPPHYLEVKGPEELIPHGIMFLYGNAPPSDKLTKIPAPGGMRKLTKAELKVLNFPASLVNPLLQDLFRQDIYNLYGFSYLTNRELDFQALRLLNDDNLMSISDAMYKGLRHAVPVIDSIPIKKILQLRHSEGEAFLLYRQALDRSIRQSKSNNLRKLDQVKELVADIIRPELDKIDATLKRERRLLGLSLRDDLTFATGFVAASLFSGLLSPDLAAIATTIGGYKFVSEVFKQGSKLVREPASLRDNQHYFLWRIERLGKKARKKSKKGTK